MKKQRKRDRAALAVSSRFFMGTRLGDDDKEAFSKIILEKQVTF